MPDITQKDLNALLATARLASELCDSVDALNEDVGGCRLPVTVLRELGPATDASDAVVKKLEKRNAKR